MRDSRDNVTILSVKLFNDTEKKTETPPSSHSPKTLYVGRIGNFNLSIRECECRSFYVALRQTGLKTAWTGSKHTCSLQSASAPLCPLPDCSLPCQVFKNSSVRIRITLFTECVNRNTGTLLGSHLKHINKQQADRVDAYLLISQFPSCPSLTPLLRLTGPTVSQPAGLLGFPLAAISRGSKKRKYPVSDS